MLAFSRESIACFFSNTALLSRFYRVSLCVLPYLHLPTNWGCVFQANTMLLYVFIAFRSVQTILALATGVVSWVSGYYSNRTNIVVSHWVEHTWAFIHQGGFMGFNSVQRYYGFVVFSPMNRTCTCYLDSVVGFVISGSYYSTPTQTLASLNNTWPIQLAKTSEGWFRPSLN